MSVSYSAIHVVLFQAAPTIIGHFSFLTQKRPFFLCNDITWEKKLLFDIWGLYRFEV